MFCSQNVKKKIEELMVASSDCFVQPTVRNPDGLGLQCYNTTNPANLHIWEAGVN